jgi:hypothetical protein
VVDLNNKVKDLSLTKLMPGGLLNIEHVGNNNIIVMGSLDPRRSLWKTTIKKPTNFGQQKFRLDYEGTPTLSLTAESSFMFKVKRYADLLMDTYISIDLPTIWSPIVPPSVLTTTGTTGPTGTTGEVVGWRPYEFQWIRYLGAQMVKRISITCGNQKLQEYSGQYLLSKALRDFTNTKLDLFHEMIGHVPELYDPGNSGARVNSYPNAYYTPALQGAAPSIHGRTLYVPIGAWFTMISTQAFPLVCLQNNELVITVTFRPVQEWFTIRDIMDPANQYPRIAPNLNQSMMQFHRFLQTPPDESLDANSYTDKRVQWDPKIHLISTYAFLDEPERAAFSSGDQYYLIRQTMEYSFPNITGSHKVLLTSLGMVTSWMFWFQRSDANLRNEWSNYTNWPYTYLPWDITPAPTVPSPGTVGVSNPDMESSIALPILGPGLEPDGTLTNLFYTDVYNPQNIHDILLSFAVVLNGEYRETPMPAGVFQFIEKYTRTSGFAPRGIYCYNFCLDTTSVQPTGAINMSMFNKVELEFTTIQPPLDPYAQSLTICDQAGNIIGINKPSWRIYDYNFDFYVVEERYNVVTFVGGNAGLMHA